MKITIIILGILLGYVVYLSNFKNKSKQILNSASNSKTLKRLTNIYNVRKQEISNQGIVSNKVDKISFNKTSILIIALFFILTIIFYKIIGVFSTSIILSFPIFFVPKIICAYLINRNKQKIMELLPGYIINLKNYVEQDNNIIFAMNDTICPEPLGRHIKIFNDTVRRGIDAKKAFKKLKESVNVKLFSSFVTAIETCYLNGGNFSRIIERFVDIISKENMNREKFREKAYSSVIILVVLVVINIYLIFSFVFSNPEYSQIVKGTVIGRLILNINAITYIFIGYLISKIYRIGE